MVAAVDWLCGYHYDEKYALRINSSTSPSTSTIRDVSSNNYRRFRVV